MISEKVAARLLLLAAQSKPDQARAYLLAIFPRSTPCDKIREYLANAGLSASALQFLGSELPWLAFGPLGESVQAEDRDIKALLVSAGADGMPRADLSDLEVESLQNEIAEFFMPTGGRPRRMVRLRQFDPLHNPYTVQAR